MPTVLLRILSWISAAFIGAIYGVAATIAHSFVVASIPVGMLVGAIACTALLLAVRTLTHDRWAALATGVGMVLTVFVISQRGPGGSVIVEDTPLGNIWLYLLVAIVIMVAAWPDLSKLRALSVRGQGAGEDPRKLAE